MDINLKHKNAVICGSTQGIGLAVAKGIAGQGASVTLVARDENRLKEALHQLSTSEYQHHQYIVADFNVPSELKAKIEHYSRENPPTHILINNSGGPPGGPILNARYEEFEVAFNRHLQCNHIMAQALIPGMKNNAYGRIINVISTSVKQPIPGLGVSNTIRGAVASWAKTLAGEVAPFNITVNNVLPGATLTNRLQSIIQSKAEKTGKSPEAIQDKMLNEIPARRFATAAEIADVIVFLSSPSAGYVNGINVPVDGGRTACL